VLSTRGWGVQNTGFAQGGIPNSVYADSIFCHLSSSLEMLLSAVSLLFTKSLLTNKDGHLKCFRLKKFKHRAYLKSGIPDKLVAFGIGIIQVT
jgi:hypothetical protein